MTKLDQTLTMLKDLTDAKGIPGNERWNVSCVKRTVFSK